MSNYLLSLYQKIVLDNAKKTLIVLSAIFIFFLIQLPNFKSDVSADAFLLQNDPDLLFTKKIGKKYSGGLSGDLLIIAYTPLDFDLYSQKSLDRIKALSDDIKKVDSIKEVHSILNMPLLFSPKVSLTDIEDGIKTLEEHDVDISLARREFQTNPFYANAFVSADEKTSALLIMVEGDEEGSKLQKIRDDLKIKQLEFGLKPSEKVKLFKANRAYNEFKTKANKRNASRIKEIRSIMDNHREGVRMFMGGASMIVVDALSFIKKDLSTFSVAVILFLVVALTIFFRQLRWVTVPVLCCSVTTLMMVGVMGFLDWRINPISSNFVALLLIITMSIAIHLVVRYRELLTEYPEADQRFLAGEAARFMFKPCLYTALTTMAAFSSLTMSGIVPVESFGKIMTLGIGLAIVICFIVFPAVLMLMPVQRKQYEAEVNGVLTNLFANFCENNARGVMVFCLAATALAGYGFTQLTVENRFIDYFHKDTEIYQGMLEIDRKLGGTTPLDIVIDAPSSFLADMSADEGSDDDFADDDFEDDDFGDFEDDQTSPLADSYWFTPAKLERLIGIHNYLESLPETGQVLSIASTYKAVVRLNDDQPFDSLKLQLLESFVPDDLKDLMMKPYLAEDGNQVRFSIRVIDSKENLERKELLAKIKTDLVEKFDLEPGQVRPASFVVLYNNMLQSLFESQFNTLGLVFVGILIMFFILFRSFYLAAISLVPNVFAAVIIIGIMGLIGLPLDLMTITVAAITIGIGVDDTIHYVHRFREEFSKDGQYIPSMRRSHSSIGMALYYTSLTIIFGFSILSASNFMPTVHFGMLTGLAMFVALMANLTLLPVLIVFFKPLGAEADISANGDAEVGSEQLEGCEA